MKLKEFSLWAYKLDLNESREFTLENRCVCAHFERHFKGIETNGVYRVVVKLSDGDDRDGAIELSNSVIKYYEKFDFSKYRVSDSLERKGLLLEALFNGMMSVCYLNDWPKQPFKIARERVVHDEYVNFYTVSTKKNSSRKFVASLDAEHTEDKFKLYITVRDKAGKDILKRLVLSEEPDEFLFNGQIGHIKWASNDVLNYLSKGDKQIIESFKIGQSNCTSASA